MTKNMRSHEKIGVVIVEDHEATLKGLNSELGAEPDIEILGIATTSKQGMSLVRELSPQVVLLDLHLPDSLGPKSLSENFLSLSDHKVIVYSGDNRSAIVNMVLQTGVDGYLLKSEPIANVARAIRDVIAGKTPVVSSELTSSDNPRVTGAEQHLLRLLARGMKYQDIAKLRVTSPETVRKQVDLLLTKLDLDTREELIAWAVERGYGNLELES
ncbi:MAG TPA: response regulator transcription factor [Candidatus Obscuribacterales bacterium]